MTPRCRNAQARHRSPPNGRARAGSNTSCDAIDSQDASEDERARIPRRVSDSKRNKTASGQQKRGAAGLTANEAFEVIRETYKQCAKDEHDLPTTDAIAHHIAQSDKRATSINWGRWCADFVAGKGKFREFGPQMEWVEELWTADMQRLDDKFEQMKRERNGRSNDAFAKRLQKQCQKWYFAPDVYLSLYKQWESRGGSESRGQLAQAGVSRSAKRRPSVGEQPSGRAAGTSTIAAATSGAAQHCNTPLTTPNDPHAALVRQRPADTALEAPTVQPTRTTANLGTDPNPADISNEQLIVFLSLYSDLKESFTALEFIRIICVDGPKRYPQTKDVDGFWRRQAMEYYLKLGIYTARALGHAKDPGAPASKRARVV